MKKKKIILIVMVAIVIIAGACGSYFAYFKPHNEAVKAYNTVVDEIQKKNDQLDGEISKLQGLVDNSEKPLDETTVETAKETLKTAGASKVIIGDMPNSTADIIARTEELSAPVDYTDSLNAISAAYTKLDNSKKQYKQVINPSEEFVLKRVLTIDDVADARAVTEDQDPNGQLHKDGGYTATIVIESKSVNQASVFVSGEYADKLIDKGTDAGGSVEVYANEEDANKRNEYLAGFDGGIFSSGFHRVVGTVVVRTSNELNATKQSELAQKIIDALTKLD